MRDAPIKKASIEMLYSEHAFLGREVAALRKLLASEFEWSALEAATSRFARRLDEHFEFEESGKYFSEVLEVDPNRSREVDRLHGEHMTMRDDLRKARHLILEGTVDRETIRKMLSELLKLQAEHEDRETRLLMDVFNTDIGAGD